MSNVEHFAVEGEKQFTRLDLDGNNFVNLLELAHYRQTQKNEHALYHYNRQDECQKTMRSA